MAPDMSIFASFLNIVETALLNPMDKAAVKIAVDGLAAWREIAGNPKIVQLVADIEAYQALLPIPPAPVEPPAAPSTQDGERGGPRGGLLPPGV